MVFTVETLRAIVFASKRPMHGGDASATARMRNRLPHAEGSLKRSSCCSLARFVTDSCVAFLLFLEPQSMHGGSKIRDRFGPSTRVEDLHALIDT